MQTPDSSMIAAERRQTPRTKLVEITYIGMGPENGGLVLDVSEGGLSFHSVAPIQLEEKVQFVLSLTGRSRIEGTGKVVWTNKIGTVCGLKFTTLSPGALEHLNNWTGKSNSSAPARVRITTPTSKNVSAAAVTKTSVLSIVPSEPVFAIPPADASDTPEPVTEARGQSALFWIALGALMIAVTGVAYSYGVRAGKTEFSTPKAAVAVTDSQTMTSTVPSPTAPGEQMAVEPKPAQVNLPAASKIAIPIPAHAFVNAAKTGTVSGPVAGSPAAAAAAAKGPSEAAKPTQVFDRNPSPSADGGKSEYAAALADLNGDNGKRDTVSAMRLLQVAVKKGSTRAEVTLADLYIYGDGIAQDCEQGRSLLTEASKNGDAQARVKLDELNSGGCP